METMQKSRLTSARDLQKCHLSKGGGHGCCSYGHSSSFVWKRSANICTRHVRLSFAALSIILHFMQTTLSVDDWSRRQLSGVNWRQNDNADTEQDESSGFCKHRSLITSTGRGIQIGIQKANQKRINGLKTHREYKDKQWNTYTKSKRDCHRGEGGVTKHTGRGTTGYRCGVNTSLSLSLLPSTQLRKTHWWNHIQNKHTHVSNIIFALFC